MRTALVLVFGLLAITGARAETFYHYDCTDGASFDVTFAADVVAGTQVWICAAWFNPRFAAGPASAPVSANLPGGNAQAA